MIQVQKVVCDRSTRMKLAREVHDWQEGYGILSDQVTISAGERLQSNLYEFRIEIDSHLVWATTCKLHPGALIK